MRGEEEDRSWCGGHGHNKEEYWHLVDNLLDCRLIDSMENKV